MVGADPGDTPLLEVGRVGRAHGVKGDVVVGLSTDRVERLAPGTQLMCRDRWLTVVTAAPHGDRWRVRFEGIDDRAAAERLTSAVLFAEPVVDPDALWVHELIGATVVERSGTPRGRCVAVIDNPAADLLELDSGALVPVTFVTELREGVVTIDPPDGLFELFDSA